jgi:H+/Cl- antiporter ClcA
MSNSVEVQFKDESMSLPLEEESTTPHDSNRGISVGGNSKHNEETMDEEERQFLSVFGSAYAKNAQFWKGIFISCLPQGILMALIALLFFNLYTALANATWLTAEYHHALNATSASLEEDSEEDPIYMFRLGNGEWWYVGLLAGAGLAVGLVKTIWNLLVPERHAFPRKVPGFLVDIQGLHADNVFLPLPMLICSAISIGLGAAVGPEAGLGATGTALGTILSKRWRLGKHQAVAFQKNGDSENLDHEQEENPSCLSKLLPDFSQDEKLMVLDGIAAAFGPLFPAQYLGVMLAFELGHHWFPGSELSAMETLARTGFSASIAFIVFTSIQNFTLLKETKLPAAAYDVLPEIDAINMFEGGVLGIVSGFVGAVGLVILGLGRVLGNLTHDAFDRVGKRLGLDKRRISLGLLLTPVVGGILVGLLCVLSPLCLSDGADQLSFVISFGRALGAGTIAVAAVVKFLCLSFSIGFGFVGGPIFPFLFTGACVGTVASLIIDGIPVLVAVPACMVAVPCACIPAIFTFTTLSSMILVLGGAATSPVFFACICSYTTVCGCGVLHKLFERSRRASSKKGTNENGAQADLMVEKEEGANACQPNDGPA